MKTNKFLSIANLLFFLILMVAVITMISLPSDNVLAYASDEITVSVYPMNEDITINDVQKPDANNYIKLVFELSRPLSAGEVVKVYYHTEDASAVASSGDYEKVDLGNYVTFTYADTTTGNVLIKVNTTTFALNFLGESDKEITTRRFKVCLDKVEGGKFAFGTPDKITCQIDYEYLYDVSIISGVNVLNDYLTFMSTVKIKETSKVSNDSPVRIDFDLLNGRTEQEVQLKYRDTGLASLYASATFEDIGEVFWNLQDVTFWLNTTENSTVLMKVNADGAFMTTTSKMGMAEIFVMCVHKKNPYVYSSYIEQMFGFTSPSLDADMSLTRFSSDYVTTRPYGENINYTFFKIPDNEDMDLYIKLENDSSARDRYWKGIEVYSQLIDSKAPEIIDYYVDSSSFANDDKLRVICRFDEPVQISDTNNVSLVGLFGSANTEVEFKYSDGNLTDTVCFEADLSEYGLTGSYASMKLDRIKGANLITDLSYRGTSALSGSQNALGNDNIYHLSKTLRGFNVDYRTPSIDETSIKCVNATSSQAINRRDFVLTIQGFSSGKIYYAFKDSKYISYNNNDSYDYCVDVTSSLSTSEDYKFNFSASNLYGEYYVHVKVVSAKTQEATHFTYGVFSGGSLIRGYYFDNQKPVISDYQVTRMGLDYSTIDLTIENGYHDYDSDIATVFVSVADDVYGLNAKSYCLYASDASNYKATSLAVKTVRDDDGYTLTLSAEDGMFGLGGDKMGGEYYLSFYAIDEAGNSSLLTDYQSFRFDKSASFSSTANIVGSKANEDGIYIYDLSQAECKITINRSDSYGNFSLYSVARGGDEIYKYNANDGDNDWKKGIADYFDVITANAQEITLKVKKSGYYEIVPSIISGDTVQTSTSVHSVYCTDNYQDATENYLATQSGMVLKTRVFMLNSSYYYLDKEAGVLSENYNNCGYSATFSNKSIAKEYVKYMEYQDLYLVQLTPQLADMLNIYANTLYVKADNEDTYAEGGQYWIRYKRDTWMVGSSYSEWAYYYYSDSAVAGIDVSYINNNLTNLKKAIDTVSDYIVGLGSYVDLVGESYVDEDTKVAYLHDGQSHVDLESAYITKLNQNFYPAVSFIGDDGLCSDNVIIDNDTLPLASNLKLVVNGYSRVYFKVKGSNDGYKLLKAKNGQTLKSAIENTTGYKQTAVYSIYEINGYGARKYDVYVDNQAPSLKINYSKNDDKAEITVTSVMTEFNCTSCTIKGFVDEVDEMSYVAISRYKTKIENVYYASDLVDGINLVTGVYYLEIGDRSGNVYNLTLKLNTSALSWSVNEVENGIKVSCIRETEEILRYEVKCNGIMVSNTYTKNKVYTASGTYSVYIRDIYGNVASKTLEYSRAIPEIPFSYSDDVDGTYETVTKDCPYVKITQADDGNTYYVVSSKYLAFRIDSELTFTIKGLAKDVDYFVSNSINSGKTGVKLNTKRSWTLVVSYVAYPDVTATYICSTENESPKFEAVYRADEYVINDSINGGITATDNTYVPNSIGITLGDKGERTFVSGANVFTNYVKIKISDNSNLGSVVVKLNGVVIADDKIEKLVDLGGEKVLVFRAKGDYTLVATDVYGNKSTFSFSNGSNGYLDYTVDGKQIDKNVGDTFGNDNVTFTMTTDGDVIIRIVDSDDKVYFYYYNIKFGTIGGNRSATVSEYKYTETKVYKKIAVGETEQLSDTEYTSIIELVSANKNTDFIVNNNHFNMTINYDSAKNVVFKIVAKDSALVVESRVSDELEDVPYCNYTVISKEISDVIIVCDGKEIAIENGSMKRINNEFAIDDAGLTSKIAKVEIAYSETKLSGAVNYKSYYANGVKNDFDMSKEGFYYIKVTNVFGNEKSYSLNMSKTFTMNTIVTDNEGVTLFYGNDYSGDIYSNGSVSILSYGESVEYTINGVKAIALQTMDEYSVTIRGNGSYVVKVKNEFGIEKTRTIHINKADITFVADILNGYNEGADKVNGYTMNKLSVDGNAVNANAIKYVSYVFNGKETVIYDDISAEKLTLTNASLVARIGENGNGEYKVIIKDIYGNVASKIISYQSNPLIVISRTIRQSAKPTEISSSEATANGVWSNNKVNVSSGAKYCVLKVNGNVVDCPKELALNSAGGDAKFDYVVEYSDEYGFSCKFDIHLLRQTISLSPIEELNLMNIDENIVTKDGVEMTYSSDAICYYQINGGNKMIYTQGEKLKAYDGVYYFIAEDKAGNASDYTIKRDTTCDFSMVETDINKQLINGGIATSSVTFSANNDTAYLATVILNGEQIPSFDGKTFNKNGKWEILVKDQVGNTKYFTFYMLLHSVCEFSYKTPYNYVISELWYNGEVKGDDAMRINKMGVVGENNSSFTVSEDGVYSVVIESLSTGEVQNFSFTIDNTPPMATLNGCEENELTTNTVMLNGLVSGDKVEIYRDGQLYISGTIGENLESPEITEGGDYKIIVTNKAGVSKEFNFQKKTIVNAAGSIFIIIVISAMVIGLFIGLLLRKRTRVDK